MTSAFIDTNIFIYHLTNNHPEFSPRSTSLLEAIENGQIEAHTSVTALDEALRVLTKFMGHSRHTAGEMFMIIFSIPDIRIEHRAAVMDAIDFWVRQSPLSFIDCYHLALTKELGMTQIFSFDKKMDRYPGIERIEP